jgi:integrase
VYVLGSSGWIVGGLDGSGFVGKEVARRGGGPGRPVSGRRSLSAVFGPDGDGGRVFESAEAELVATAQPALDGDVITAVLDSFLRDGKLVPAAAAVASLDGVTDEVARRRIERAQMLNDLRARALADATLIGYGGHVRAWKTWARAEGIPALPLNPRDVADFLLDYALLWDYETDAYARDSDGHLVPAVAMSSVSLRLQALNKLAEFVGLPRPGDNLGLKETLAGLRRTFGTRANGKAALDLSLVNKLLKAADNLTYTDTRDRAIHLLRARTNATAGQLAQLTWADIDPAADGTTVTITLAKSHKHGKPSTVTVPAHSNPDLCLVTVLNQMQAVAPKLRELLTHRDGRALSRQAIHALTSGQWDTLPHMDDRALAGLVESACPTTPTSTTRDRALLLVGFYTALRRSNLSALNWADVTDHGDDGLALLIRRSKTDQEGKGRIAWVPQADNTAKVACPATALRAWRQQLEAALGRAVKPEEPVFTALTSGGTVKTTRAGGVKRLTGDGVNETVQRLTVNAGLAKPGEANPYGAHSLRAGFVTEAVRDDKLSIVEVMEVTGHASTEMVARYRRETNQAKRNAGRKLMGVLAGG